MNEKSHKNTLLYAKNILRNDGHLTFAYTADTFESELLHGTVYADRAADEVYLDIDLRSIWTFGEEINSWRKHICNLSSFSHYYDPATDQGLDLSEYGDLEGWIEAGGVLAAIIVGLGGVWADLSISPEINFNNPYPSAVDECQKHYTRAVQIWRGLVPSETGYPWADAMFHLGWASHYIADMCTSPHTVSDKFWSHGEYEDVIDTVQSDPGVHAQTIGNNLAQYNLNISARQLAVQAATETRQELFLYDDKNRWVEGARLAIPRAERYTARLLAKFFSEVGVAAIPRPLDIHVLDLDETPIANAVVFYRTVGNEWKPLLTDAQGFYRMILPANAEVEFRPAAPGYLFEGRYNGDAPTIPEFPVHGSPVSYHHAPNPLQNPSITFRLRSMVQAPPFVVMTLDPTIEHTLPHILEPVHVEWDLDPADVDVVDKAIAEQVYIEVMGPRPNSEPDLVAGSLTPVHVRVTVYEPIEVATGQFIRSRADFQRIIELGRNPHALELANRRAGAHHVREVEVSAEVLEALSRAETIQQAHEVIYTEPDLGWDNSILGKTPTIFVRANGSHRITIQVMQEPKLVGYGCTGPVSVDIRTNSYEEAWGRLLAGNQAGRLKLEITAYSEEGDRQIAKKTVELWVKPTDEGGNDLTPMRAPHLEEV